MHLHVCKETMFIAIVFVLVKKKKWGKLRYLIIRTDNVYSYNEILFN